MGVTSPGVMRVRGGGAAVVLFVMVVASGCDEPSCREVTTGGERYCVAPTPAVIEGGITCPVDLPYELELERGIVCSATPIGLDDLPPEVCAQLGGCEPPTRPSSDGGARDGGQDAGRVDGRWVALPPAPHARVTDCAAGTDRIGYYGGRGGVPTAQTLVAGGAALDLSSAAWRAFPAEGQPSARVDAVVARTSTGWFVFGGDGGSGSLADGAFLADEASAWRALPATGAPSGRKNAAVAWTGREVLVWGGSPGTVPANLGDGAAFDPARFEWRSITAEGAPGPRTQAASAWTGTELFIFGGLDRGVLLRDGGSYDPAADRWRPLTPSNAPLGRINALAAWTGEYVIVWGGSDATGPRRDGGAYDVRHDTWRSIPPVPVDLVPVTATWLVGGLLGGALVVVGATDDTFVASAGAAFDLVSFRWRQLTLEGSPAPRRSPCALTTEQGVAVLMGAARDRYLDDGARLEEGP